MGLGIHDASHLGVHQKSLENDSIDYDGDPFGAILADIAGQEDVHEPASKKRKIDTPVHSLVNVKSVTLENLMLDPKAMITSNKDIDEVNRILEKFVPNISSAA